MPKLPQYKGNIVEVEYSKGICLHLHWTKHLYTSEYSIINDTHALYTIEYNTIEYNTTEYNAIQYNNLLNSLTTGLFRAIVTDIQTFSKQYKYCGFAVSPLWKLLY